MEELIILYEDNHIIVTLKPQNVPTCEDESRDKDMLTYIKEYIREKYGKQGNVYLGLVHRLDRPTGGVMVFAKSSKAAARLSEQMKSGDFEKKYLAVLADTPREERATLKNYLKKNPINNMVYLAAATTAGRSTPNSIIKFSKRRKGLRWPRCACTRAEAIRYGCR